MGIIQAVFFDLDNTLQDLDSAFHVAMLEEFGPMCNQSGIELSALSHALQEIWPSLWEEFMAGECSEKSLYPRWFARAVASIGLKVTETTLYTAVQAYQKTFERALSLYPDVIPALRRLGMEASDLHLAILTNGPGLRQSERIAALGLDAYIRTCVISGDVGVGKPEPAFFQHACRHVDVSPENVIMIGDTWSTDIIGGRDMGMKTIWLNRGHHWDDHPADGVASNLIEAVSIVLEWTADAAR